MVEANTDDPLQLATNEQQLKLKLEEYYAKRDSYEVVRRTEKDNLIVQQVVEGNFLTILVTYKLIPGGLLPKDFIYFIEHWAEFTKKFNDYCRDVVPMEGTGTKYKTYKLTSKVPWPLDERYAFAVCYPFINYGEDEHLIMASDHGLETKFSMNTTDRERKSHVLARMHFSAWWFKPVKDSNGDIIGTSMFAVVNGDAGGAIPKWVQDITAPMAAIKASQDFTKAMIKAKLQSDNASYKLLLAESETHKEFSDLSNQYQTYLETNKKKIPSKVRNELFGLYQQGQFGECTMSKPGIFSGEKKRYDSWQSLKGVSMKDAQLQFIEKVKAVLQ